jgi:hypothetical protein
LDGTGCKHQGSVRHVYRLAVGKPEMTRSPDRPMRRGEENIKV